MFKSKYAVTYDYGESMWSIVKSNWWLPFWYFKTGEFFSNVKDASSRAVELENV